MALVAEAVAVLANMAAAAPGCSPPGAERAHLCPPVVAGPGPGQHRVDRPPVWLVEEAVRLGWARSAVEVIDADLGLSGRSAEHRSGYKELVGRVCLGEVGAIFGLDR